MNTTSKKKKRKELSDFPQNDLAIDFGIKSDTDNLARDPGQSRLHDCSTHVMAADSSLLFRPLRQFPRSVFQADTIMRCGLVNFEVTTWSKHRCHKNFGSTEGTDMSVRTLGS